MQQSVDMSIQLPSALQYDPVQMAEVVQQEYVLVCRAWLYPVAATEGGGLWSVAPCENKIIIKTHVLFAFPNIFQY